MNDHLDPEKLKIPAYLRKKAIVRQSKQKLILTALDRKQAGLDVHSQKALAPIKSFKSAKERSTAKAYKHPIIKKSKATSFPHHPKYSANIQTPFPAKSSSRLDPSSSRFLGDLYRNDSQINRQPEVQKMKQQKSNSFLRRLLPVNDEREAQTPLHEAPRGFVEIIQIGYVTAYFEKIQVAVIKLEKPLRVGDLIQITGDEMLFQQPVDSLQINRKPVKIGKKGAEIGLKVNAVPKLNGPVYKVLI